MMSYGMVGLCILSGCVLCALVATSVCVVCKSLCDFVWLMFGVFL